MTVFNADHSLHFEHVSIPLCAGCDTGMRDVSFSLAAGEAMLVRLERQRPRIPLFDAAEGLIEPSQGVVCFNGRDWRRCSPDRAAASRAAMGRVFSEWGWVSNLDVDENITLRERHMTRRPVEQIHREALALARRLGMEKLPQLRPAWVDRAALQRAQWVRALLGRPALLLLDQPGQHVSAAALSPLADAVQEAMDRGATVVWFTLDDGVWNNAPVRMKYRRMMQGERLVDDVET